MNDLCDAFATNSISFASFLANSSGIDSTSNHLQVEGFVRVLETLGNSHRHLLSVSSRYKASSHVLQSWSFLFIRTQTNKQTSRSKHQQQQTLFHTHISTHSHTNSFTHNPETFVIPITKQSNNHNGFLPSQLLQQLRRLFHSPLPPSR